MKAPEKSNLEKRVDALEAAFNKRREHIDHVVKIIAGVEIK